MADNTLFSRLKGFLGLHQEPPKNEFRNPIWGSDDDDDGDELYTKNNIDIHTDPLEKHREFARQMHDMFRSFGSIFDDMKTFFDEDHNFDSFASITEMPDTPAEPDDFNSNNIRDYYLKSGYHNQKQQPKEDIDLDGKISSQEISGLLKRKDDEQLVPVTPFNGNLVPGRSFCKTIITTSITKPDGSIETRRIVKNGNETVETTTTTEPVQGPYDPTLMPVASTNIIYNNILSELTSFFRNFN